MGTRRKARETALQFLFQDDFQHKYPLEADDLEERFALFCGLYQVNSKAKEYALVLIRQTIANSGQIDALIRQCAKNWRLERIAYADRNLLRIAVCEMLYCEDVPHQVSINEAVEIAKRFGSAESSAFVNGILDAVNKHIQE
ncbi:MAG: transcription antitermination factor NusB [Desulfopila sp.]|jgi:N utilization substance protein B|nr:transcription antitermination factor NusB [Desulfopila sp.]